MSVDTLRTVAFSTHSGWFVFVSYARLWVPFGMDSIYIAGCHCSLYLARPWVNGDDLSLEVAHAYQQDLLIRMTFDGSDGVESLQRDVGAALAPDPG